jgi:hypothetical protein
MFDLEQAMKRWRKSLQKNEAMEDGYRKELESHIREEIENQIELGQTPETAFKTALEMLGSADSIGAEYYKSHTRRRSGRPHLLPGIVSLGFLFRGEADQGDRNTQDLRIFGSGDYDHAYEGLCQMGATGKYVGMAAGLYCPQQLAEKLRLSSGCGCLDFYFFRFVGLDQRCCGCQLSNLESSQSKSHKFVKI